MNRWVYALILPLFFFLGDTRGNVLDTQDEVRRELGELDKLSDALTEICTRLGPEIKAIHTDIARVHRGAESRINILKPVWDQLSERELLVERLRSEQARALAELAAINFVEKELDKGPQAFRLGIRHRILLLSQKQVPEQRATVNSIRSELNTLSRARFQTHDEYLRKAQELRESLDKATDQMFQLTYEADWLTEVFRDRANLRRDGLKTRRASVEGQVGLYRNQLIAEEMSVRSLREKAMDLERDLGQKSDYVSTPPFLPAICSRVR